jgi:RHS repeat-associated protein
LGCLKLHTDYDKDLKTHTVDYKFGFNGKEQDNSIKSQGNSYDFGARIYDSRLGRFFSTDPLERKYPWQTPYAYFRNSIIKILDILGMGGGDEPDNGTNPSLASQDKGATPNQDDLYLKFKFKANMTIGSLSANIKFLGAKAGYVGKFGKIDVYGVNLEVGINLAKMEGIWKPKFNFFDNNTAEMGTAVNMFIVASETKVLDLSEKVVKAVEIKESYNGRLASFEAVRDPVTKQVKSGELSIGVGAKATADLRDDVGLNISTNVNYRPFVVPTQKAVNLAEQILYDSEWYSIERTDNTYVAPLFISPILK